MWKIHTSPLRNSVRKSVVSLWRNLYKRIIVCILSFLCGALFPNENECCQPVPLLVLLFGVFHDGTTTPVNVCIELNFTQAPSLHYCSCVLCWNVTASLPFQVEMMCVVLVRLLFCLKFYANPVLSF